MRSTNIGIRRSPISSAVFGAIKEALGDASGPLESIGVPRLLALAYAVGWSGNMLSVNPVDFAGELEASLEKRGGYQDIGATADTNLATAQSADAAEFVWRFAIGQ